MKKRNNKKGFTIVELVIVIAVIAILAAVLIPTFSSVIKKAKVNNDIQLVRNLNTALATDNKKHKTMQSALDAAFEFGYDVAKINNTSVEENEILWDSKNDVFCYLKDSTLEYVPNSVADDDKLSVNSYLLWKISKTVDPTYSTYYTGDATTFTGENAITKGFDAGTTKGITAIEYENNTDQKVVIRTNSFATTLTINDRSAQGKIYHYDNLGKLIITHCAMESYHEMGTVGYAELKNGHLAVEENASINLLFANTQDSATLKITNNGTITNAQASSDTVKQSNTISRVDFNRASAETVPEDDITNAVQETHQSNCEHANVVVSKDEVKATCTQKGSTVEKKCQDCNKILVEQQEIPMIPHSFVSVDAVSATNICTVCGTLDLENDKLNDKAFINNKLITKIVIPEGVTEIGNKAFYGCTNLESVTIPASVTTIGAQAFSNCTLLTSVTLESGLTTIGEKMFYGCTNLESVTIPDSVTSIGSSAFYNCKALESITIPERVTSIGNDAFSGCTNLTSVTIPEGVKTIGQNAFYKCTSLESITIPKSVTSIGSSAFYGCSSLSSVTISEEVTTIGSGAFQNCTKLTNIKIPDSVTGKIDGKTFSNCSNLKSITIGAGITHISMGKSGAFNGTNLETIVVSSENGTYKSEGNCILTKDGTKLVLGCKNSIIPDGRDGRDKVTTIGQYAFYMCSGLTGIAIPASVTTIEDYAFSGSSLTTIEIPATVKSIGKCAFMSCKNLTTVTLNANISLIAEGLFSQCSNLESITIPSSVTEIGGSAFFQCKNLTSITIPDSVTTIGKNAFKGAGLTTAKFEVTDGWNCTYRNSATMKDVTQDNIAIAPGASEANANLLKGETSYTDPSFSRQQ